ncbi:MAG TPA: hypothetical protein VFZ16_21560 [Hyphomicrobiaceae bacterium]|nr:hypothetical protein [Hyphomicrobiaceae bacterium]
MHRLFILLALAAGLLALWVLIAGPGVDPVSGGQRQLSQPAAVYNAWAIGLLMGLLLAWLATTDWSKFPQWLRLQRKRIGLLILGGVAASVLLLF